MASTAPATKSQPPPHTFALPRHLKWNNDGHQAAVDQHHRPRRSTKSPSFRPNASFESSYDSTQDPFPIREMAEDPPPPQHLNRQLETKSKGKEVESSSIKKSKILIKIPCSRTEEAEKIPIPPPDVENKAAAEGDADARRDEETKMWNLRPRKSTRRPMGPDEGGPVRINGSKKNKARENCEKKEKKKRKVSISLCLSKEEIEEDIFAMVGSKPAKRPRKRSKHVQRLLDNLYPGSCIHTGYLKN